MLVDDRVPGDPEATHVALEATYGWEWLAELLEEAGYDVLAHPRHRRTDHVVVCEQDLVRGVWFACHALADVADARIEKWTTWIDGTIKNELLTMHLHRFAWQEATKLIEDNAELPESYWWEFMYETYAITQAAAVRRQADVRRDVVSLARFLMDVRKGAAAITRTYWIDTLWEARDQIDRTVAGRQWDVHYGGSVGDYLDPAIPKKDFETLIAAAEDVKKYVDENIAHASADPVARQVTVAVSDVHPAMDTFGELFGRYYTLLTASTLATLTPIPQHDFFAVFRQPWMREGYTTSSGPFYRA